MFKRIITNHDFLIERLKDPEVAINLLVTYVPAFSANEPHYRADTVDGRILGFYHTDKEAREAVEKHLKENVNEGKTNE